MTRRSGRREQRSRSTEKVDRMSMMSTNFSHWNTTIEPHFRVSRISTSSPNSSFGLSKDVIIILEALLFYKKVFVKRYA